MKLEDFKNKYLNNDIYIIGSGKSLDFIEPDFFNNKITIGINQVYKKMNTTYLIRKELSLSEQVIKNNMDKIIFISKGNCGNNNEDNLKLQLKNKYNNVCIFNHPVNIMKITNLPEDDNKLIVSYSTITSGIHLAAYMGAKNIILVGHDCGKIDGESFFTNYHNKETLSIAWKDKGINAYNNFLKNIENHTITLKKLLKEKYNCNIYSLNPFINFNLEGHTFEK
jgi:hypothetical protein